MGVAVDPAFSLTEVGKAISGLGPEVSCCRESSPSRHRSSTLKKQQKMTEASSFSRTEVGKAKSGLGSEVSCRPEPFLSYLAWEPDTTEGREDDAG